MKNTLPKQSQSNSKERLMKFKIFFIILAIATIYKGIYFYKESRSPIILTQDFQKNLADLQIKQEFTISSGNRAYNHSPAISSIGKDKLIASWYAGDYEGGINMGLYIKYFDGKKWHNEQEIIKPQDLDHKTRRIGNSIVFSHPKNPQKTYIIFTSTLGGWATSYLNLITSNDQGKNWSKPQRLYLGNILNFSHLVRGKPFFYENGNILLPIYNEFINKLGVALTISPKGKVLSYSKLSKYREAIQPSINFINDKEGVFFLRNTNLNKNGKKTLVGNFSNNFNNVSNLRKINIPNINTSVATIKNKENILIAYTDSLTNKDNLSLGVINQDFSNFKPLFPIYKGLSKYPYIIKKENKYHLTYSVEGGKEIRHIILY